MMQIIAKTECCGCGACSQVCRHGCVSMREDEQGFLYPYVEKSLCIDCGLCGIVCPVLHQGESTPPLLTLASLNNKDNVREFSSSGGVFFSLAEKTIKEGGIVFGARFNEKWEVIHDYTDTLEGLFPLMGSKYVQSRVGDTYKEAKAFLQSGRKVLYSGTPCQILALKNFLNRDYENLLTVDVVCHGVPSPRVWRDYLKFILNEERRTVKRSCQSDDPVISEISFRNKKGGWRRFRLLINGSNTATYGGGVIRRMILVIIKLWMKSTKKTFTCKGF